MATATSSEFPDAGVAVTEIALASDLFALIDSGRKRQTIRNGVRAYPLGPAVFSDGGTLSRAVTITEVRHMRFSDVTEEIALADGFDSVAELHEVLLRFYPTFTVDDEITVVAFALR